MNSFKQFGACFLVMLCFCFCSASITPGQYASKKVVYTCICGGYDSLVPQTYRHEGWDYVCFTDNEELLARGDPYWQVRPLAYAERDHGRNNRWHKILPHLILPEYEVSFYIDGNTDIINSKIFDYFDRELLANESISLAMTKHPEINCLYQEARRCKNRLLDHADVIDRQMAIFRSLHYPEHNGLVDASMIYRRHHNEKVKKIMEDWWYWVSTGSRRDQLSFNFVVWANQFKIHIFKEPFAHNKKYINYLPHVGKRDPG